MTADLGALAPIAARKLREAETLHCAAAGLWAKAETLPAAPEPSSVLRDGAVIAEMKRRSPSGGALRQQLEPGPLARAYRDAGCAAISVLTDAPAFGGSLDDLAAVRSAVALPLLRKDFTVDPVQVAEARVAGADWVLLIVAILEDTLLDDCLDAVQRARAGVLVEVHDEAEVERALRAGAQCIGINNRDLRTLRTNLDTFSRLRRLLPEEVTCVAESGIREPSHAARLVAEGADAVLVGEALMRAPDAAAQLEAIVDAARGAAV